MAKSVNQKSHAPKLRFKGFEDNWNNIKIDDLVNNKILDKPLDGNHGNIHPVASDFVKSGIPFIMANNIRNGQLILSGATCIKKEQADKLQKGFSIEGDLLLTHKGSVGFTAIVPKLETEYIMLTPQVTYYRVLDKKQLLNLFLKSVFDSFRFQKRLQTLADSGTRPYIGITQQRELEISIPSLREQQKIASFLSAVDEKIQQLTRKKELLEQYKKGVMQQLFSGKLRFKDENAKPYPKWEEKKFGEVLEIGSGRDYKHLGQGSIPVFGTGGLMTMVDDFLYDGETVCIGRKGTIDKPMFHSGKIWTVDTLFYTHSFKNALPKFVYYVFKLINWRGHNEASGVPSLSKTTIEKLKFKFPSVEEQQKIASFLTSLDAKIESVTAQITSTQTFKKGLLQQMFV